jgi:allantoinase
MGYDADLVLLDPTEVFTVRAEDPFSSQGYPPFEGLKPTGRVKSTFMRGDLVYHRGEIIGPLRGRYLERLCGMAR